MTDGNPESRSYAPRTAALPDLAGAAARGMVRYAQIDESVLRGSRALEGKTEGVRARGRGLAALGEGLQDLGEAGADLHHEVQRARGITAESKADGLMARLKSEAMAKMEKTDPEKWQAVRAEAVKGFKSQMEKEQMPAFARDAIQLKADQWDKNFEGEVKIGAARVHIQNARTAMGDRRAALLGRGDYAGAVLVNKQMTKVGLQNQRTELANAAEIQHTQKTQTAAAEKKAVTDAVKADPRAWLAGNQKPAAIMTAELHEYGVNLAQLTDRRNVAGDLDRLETALHDGTITVPAEIESWEPDNVRLTPSLRQKSREHFVRLTNAGERERMRVAAPEMASRLLSELTTVDPKTVSDEQLAGLRHRLAELPKEYRALPAARYGRLWSSAGDQSDSGEDSLLALGERNLQELLEGGKFGVYAWDEPVRNARGEPVRDETGAVQFKRGHDEGRYRDAVAAKARAGGMLARYLKRNPQAGEEAMLAFMRSGLSTATRISIANDYDPLPARRSEGPSGPDHNGGGETVLT